MRIRYVRHDGGRIMPRERHLPVPPLLVNERFRWPEERHGLRESSKAIAGRMPNLLWMHCGERQLRRGREVESRAIRSKLSPLAALQLTHHPLSRSRGQSSLGPIACLSVLGMHDLVTITLNNVAFKWVCIVPVVPVFQFSACFAKLRRVSTKDSAFF